MARGRKKHAIKRANGTGSIKKLSGNRRKPFAVLITTKYENNAVDMSKKQIQKVLGTYETRELAMKALNEYNSNPYDIEKETITFVSVYESWLVRYYADIKNDSTKRSNMSAFNHSKPLHDMVFNSITITNMKDTINAAKVGSATKGRMKSLYNLLYDFAVESGITTDNKARNFTMKGLQKRIIRERKSKDPFTLEYESNQNGM